MQDGTCSWVVQPDREATVMPLDWGIFDFRRSRSSTDPRLAASPGSSAVELPLEETSELPLLIEGPPMRASTCEKEGDRLASTCAPTTAAGTLASSFATGQLVQVYSQSKGAWLNAQVAAALPDGSVTVQLGASKSRQTLQREDLAWMVKTF
mmetsp:Transcript_90958/g.241585  ORF Transcript_90958/g.241585 Transcript_90958/m.241585 type:complete len:152 (-) Transcript_90958:7-462(-)